MIVIIFVIEKHNMIRPGSFADGIRSINTKGALVRPARLTKARAILLLDFIEEFKRNWYCHHDESETLPEQEDDMQLAMQWIFNQINKRWSQNELYDQPKKKK